MNKNIGQGHTAQGHWPAWRTTLQIATGTGWTVVMVISYFELRYRKGLSKPLILPQGMEQCFKDLRCVNVLGLGPPVAQLILTAGPSGGKTIEMLLDALFYN